MAAQLIFDAIKAAAALVDRSRKSSYAACPLCYSTGSSPPSRDLVCAVAYEVPDRGDRTSSGRTGNADQTLSGRYNLAGPMPLIDLTDKELAALTSAVRRVIDENRFSLLRASHRCARRWRSLILPPRRRGCVIATAAPGAGTKARR